MHAAGFEQRSDACSLRPTAREIGRFNDSFRRGDDWWNGAVLPAQECRLSGLYRGCVLAWIQEERPQVTVQSKLFGDSARG